MIRFDTLLLTLLIVLAVASGLGVASSQHEVRKLHSALEREQIRTQNLIVERGRLEIEQSTLADPRRVEAVARERLGMVSPDAGRIIVLEDGRP